MISLLAAFACIVFVVYLFRRDIKCNPGESKALWVPLLWMFLAGGRWASAWLNLGAPMSSAAAYSEGSPIDRTVFLGLIIAGVVILARRDIDWTDLLARNKLLALYFLFCLVSISWSDEPFVAFKRWFKDLGNPIMVLVILTTPRPLQSLTQTLRWLSFLFLPLSVLFVKYFPELGRVYHVDGSPMYTGVGSQKNDLGLICLVTGIYLLWQILIDRERFSSWAQSERLSVYLLAIMMAWLLYMSNSQTALVCIIASGGAILGARLSFVRRRPGRLIGLILTIGLIFGALEAAFDIKAQILELLGREPSLTNRTDLWALLFSVAPNPVFGAGFMSFWTGERMDKIWSVWGGVNQAHSGYLEQYLNLGYVGVGFMVLLLLSALQRARYQLSRYPSMGVLQLCFVVAAILYNYTEASFYGINNMWVLFLVAAMRPPRLARSTLAGELGHDGSPRTL